MHDMVWGWGSMANVPLLTPSTVMQHYDTHNRPHAIVKCEQYVCNPPGLP
jgi:hypothetical protein